MLRTKARFDPAETQRERDHQEIAYRAALESIVLLENDGTLPLAPGRVALYGAGARRTIKGGTGSGEMNERHSVSIYEGLQKAGFEVSTPDWLDQYDRAFDDGERDHARQIRKSISLFNLAALARIMTEVFLYPFGHAITEQDIKASDTDTCIYVLARQSGEGADRRLDKGEFSISPLERHNIETCARAYRRTIVVVNVGATFDLSFKDEIDGISALIYFGQQGGMGGIAFADLLTGRATPSGKLVDTWMRRYDDVPFAHEYSYLNSDPDNAYYKEDIYVGYRYFDTFGVAPLYPFGYGLGYAAFSIECLDAAVDKTRVRLRVRVCNTSARFAGQEVVQVYASCPQTAAGKEYQRLVAFAKSSVLQVGATQELLLEVDLSACASFDETIACTVLDAGDYIFRIGNSSRSTVPIVVASLDACVTLAQHASICPLQKSFERLKPEQVVYGDDLSQAVRLVLRAADFGTVVHAYTATPTDTATPPGAATRTDLTVAERVSKPVNAVAPSRLSTPANAASACGDANADALMRRLTLRDMLDLVVGGGMRDVLFSRNWFNCPGAIGNTTSRLVDKGIPNATLADGPAGLRLQKRSSVSRKGAVRMVDAQINFFNYLPALFRRFLFGHPDSDRMIYQYTTALPVGLALAQTWNLDLMASVGQLVGREMHEYGVTWWLAPGINIHRNPLCGRNFEYFSEDPFLSGKLAAAVTRGCQSLGGVYVTVKHFCANNQEENRNKVSSHISERALREIYLRGFEIAVREGGAKSVMTSYNRVNGVYTANSHDLCTKVLRNEWGFDGTVMTDWFSTGRRLANSGLCQKAGNDLLMPGSWYDRYKIRAELRSGRITEADVRRCATNVLRSIMNSQLAAEYPCAAADTAPSLENDKASH